MALTRTTRIRYGVALAVSLGAVAWLVAGPLRGNIEYFRTASEAVAHRASEGTHRFRLAGQVVDGSVHDTSTGMDFDVTDGAATVHVVFEGAPPQLFKDGAPVVCEGRWDGSHFASDRILIRHGNEYSPPKVTTTVPAGASS